MFISGVAVSFWTSLSDNYSQPLLKKADPMPTLSAAIDLFSLYKKMKSDKGLALQHIEMPQQLNIVRSSSNATRNIICLDIILKNGRMPAQ